MTTTTATYSCERCSGTGRLPKFSHVRAGRCFRCDGTGVVTRKTEAPNRFQETNAMHCRTLKDAQEYRLSEFDRRFPGLLERASDEIRYAIANGCGRLRNHVEALAR